MLPNVSVPSSPQPVFAEPVVTLLSDGWQVAQRLPASYDLFLREGGEKTWHPATVPGHVHRDLVQAGVIADPFWRHSETGTRWVDEADWTYQTTFTVDAERLALRGRDGRHFLHFHGLDTLARVLLNGSLVGTSENFFVPARFDVTDVLREGENVLRVEFDSALRVGRERSQEYLGDGTSERGKATYFNFGPRAFVRKPQYMFGWDWGPELVSCGVWQPVELITVPCAEIVDWRMDYTFTDPVTVDITLQLTVEKYVTGPLTVGAALYAPGDNTPSAVLPNETGRHTVTLEIYDQKVAVWNPNGLSVMPSVNGLRPKGGPRKRYFLNFKVTKENAYESQIVAFKGVSVGFRSVELVQEPDADGTGSGFLFRVNGVDTFIKGANWIPDGSFPGEITESQLRQRLTQARDAGFNMLRVWGGGLYESDTFYNLCDELGLLVWQDFALACSMYPDDLNEFVESVRAEAVANVRRVRHHPCLALWCGGNENLQLFQQRWSGADQATQFFGNKLIHEVFPQVLAEEDTRTPYWPNSPYSNTPDLSVSSQDDSVGDAHYWNVWHGAGDWVHYAENDCRFSSEFGFAAPAGLAAWESCTLPEDRQVGSSVSRWHDKTRKGHETYLNYISLHYPEPQSWEDMVYYGQLNQANALQFGVEHWRRRKGRCWGTLFWQLNDCWPTHSWAVIDSAGEPKAAYYATKRFYAPLLLSLVRNGDTVEAHLVHDPETSDAPPPTGTIALYINDVDEIADWSVHDSRDNVSAPSNGASGVVLSLRIPPQILSNESQGFASAQFVGANGELYARNLLLLSEPKDIQLHVQELNVTLQITGKGTADVTLYAPTFAPYVWLRFFGVAKQPQFSDNFFHLVTSERRTIHVTGLPEEMDAEELEALLRVRTLASGAKRQ